MKKIILLVLFLIPVMLIFSCINMAASAEEYYSIGMSYFELGKYEEAEKWLNRARQGDKTMVASQYNLGRLAYERQRYNEAARHFEEILKKDPDNILALQAAAYTRIKTGDFALADQHYAKVLRLVPESADDGYNHALVLYAMERYGEAEQVLEKYLLSLLENNDTQLLYARCQNAQNKVEAIDSYSLWLNNNTDAKVRHEYAQVLESHEFYAKAIEEYRKALTETAASDKTLNKDIRFSLARILLIADSESGDGITELQNLVKDGFDNIEAVEELLAHNEISNAGKESIRNIIIEMNSAAKESNKGKDD